jgi:hypothetical protein
LLSTRPLLSQRPDNSNLLFYEQRNGQYLNFKFSLSRHLRPTNDRSNTINREIMASARIERVSYNYIKHTRRRIRYPPKSRKPRLCCEGDTLHKTNTSRATQSGYIPALAHRNVCRSYAPLQNTPCSITR